MAKKKKKDRMKIVLKCDECKRKNYTTTKNRKNTSGKLKMKKYCSFDKKHTLHKEAKI
ncbi:MAG: 50S ribosomal protein L33 [bacterium]